MIWAILAGAILAGLGLIVALARRGGKADARLDSAEKVNQAAKVRADVETEASKLGADALRERLRKRDR